MKRTALIRHSSLRRVTMRRLEQLGLYWVRRERFLRQHPYYQLWLAEHGVPENHAIREKGILHVGTKLRPVVVPPQPSSITSTMALSWAGHQQIEWHKAGPARGTLSCHSKRPPR